MRAEYRIEDIDPKSLGWGGRAADYLWVRVIKDSVEFNGTWADDVDIFRVTPSAAELDAAAQAFAGSRRRSPSRRLAAPSPRSSGEAGTYPG